jgi:hypothetical protein
MRDLKLHEATPAMATVILKGDCREMQDAQQLNAGLYRSIATFVTRLIQFHVRWRG